MVVGCCVVVGGALCISIDKSHWMGSLLSNILMYVTTRISIYLKLVWGFYRWVFLGSDVFLGYRSKMYVY